MDNKKRALGIRSSLVSQTHLLKISEHFLKYDFKGYRRTYSNPNLSKLIIAKKLKFPAKIKRLENGNFKVISL
jgi:hypothetical protein